MSQPESRVCDRCVQKRLRCDRQRPTCSRCRESRVECAYSLKRRPPGPSKGYRYGKRSKQPAPQVATTSDTLPSNTDGPEPQKGTVMALNIDQVMHRSVLDAFFEQIHPSIPLFDRTKFMASFEANPDLALWQTVAALCLVISRASNECLVDIAKQLLSYRQSILDQQYSTHTTEASNLEKMQEACLLAYFAFHHSPDRTSWLRIGHVTRLAYALGLHQLDSLSPGLVFERTLGSNDLEAWRRLWWVIYALDSFSNNSAGTPLLIEFESISTAIRAAQINPHNSAVYLPGSIGEVWTTIHALAKQQPIDHFAIQIAVTAMLNESARLYRLAAQRVTPYLRARVQPLDDVLDAARFALPPGYLTPGRAVSSGESVDNCHKRIGNVMLLESARLFVHAAGMLLDDDPVNAHPLWNMVLGDCEFIVRLVKTWDDDFLTAVDPALCCIATTVLMFQEVYSRCSDLDIGVEIQDQISRHDNILILFLEQFARHWQLARSLLASHEQLRRCLPKRMLHRDAQRLLKAYNGILHQRLLQEPAQPVGETLPPSDMDMSWLDLLNGQDWSGMTDFFTEFNAHLSFS